MAELHSEADSRVWVDHFPPDEDRLEEFWCLNIGGPVHGLRVFMQPEFIHKLARVMGNLEAQLMLREMVEKEKNGEGSCP